MSGPMVRAILAGAKTQTRRVVRVDNAPVVIGKDVLRRQRGIPSDAKNVRMCGPYVKCDAPAGSDTVSSRVVCPYGVPGDRLWVRETFALSKRDPESFEDEDTKDPSQWDPPVYRADGETGEWERTDERGNKTKIPPPWRPSIFLPRWASRITLDVVSVRVERVHDITEADAEAEGVSLCNHEPIHADTHARAFACLWDAINGKRARASWAANPWVWRVEFRRLEER